MLLLGVQAQGQPFGSGPAPDPKTARFFSVSGFSEWANDVVETGTRPTERKSAEEQGWIPESNGCRQATGAEAF